MLEQESDIGASCRKFTVFSGPNLFKKFNKEYSVRLIEDCAQSTGTIFKNSVGTIADAGTLAFPNQKSINYWGWWSVVVTELDL